MSKLTTLPRLAWRHIANAAGFVRHARNIDAILASYPKSGRTWFRFILSSYIATAFGLDARPDLHSMFTIMPNFDMDPVRGLPAFRYAEHRPPLPLIAVSHLPYAQRRFQDLPVVFMLRDPRDVMVSSYFHATRQKHRFSGEMDAFLRDPVHGTAALTHYLNGWAAGLRGHRHILVSYEALTRDPHRVTGDVLRFLGLTPQPEAIALAVTAASFGNMQQLELATGLPGHNYDRSDGEGLRMRRGKVGGFAEYLTPEQIDLIQTSCARNLTPAAKAMLDEATRWPAQPATAAG